MKRAFFSSLLLVMLADLLSMPASAGDIELGEYLSNQCTTCHQLSGADKGIPGIVGWDEESFVAVMNSYKSKERENEVMQNIAVNLSEEELAALAAYFATIKPENEPSDATTVSGRKQ